MIGGVRTWIEVCRRCTSAFNSAANSAFLCRQHCDSLQQPTHALRRESTSCCCVSSQIMAPAAVLMQQQHETEQGVGSQYALSFSLAATSGSSRGKRAQQQQGGHPRLLVKTAASAASPQLAGAVLVTSSNRIRSGRPCFASLSAAMQPGGGQEAIAGAGGGAAVAARGSTARDSAVGMGQPAQCMHLEHPRDNKTLLNTLSSLSLCTLLLHRLSASA